mmetsp:Transcript_5191/g.7984  ORF Transcript_5191/g.7984 Transcript_5191/m.7984 type:complete len:560 (-) Transcript_5191:2329-4008(-)
MGVAMWIIVVLWLLWDGHLKVFGGSTSREAEDAAKHVVFVSVPVFRHVDPIVEIIHGLETQKHKNLKVSLVLPRWFGETFFQRERMRKLCQVVDCVMLDRVTKPDQMLGNGNFTQAQLRSLYELSMTDALVDMYASPYVKDGTPPENRKGIDLIVTDRYTFAGFNLANYLNIPLVVHNPWTLLDIDKPPQYIPSPFSDTKKHDGVLMRAWNMWLRLCFRIEERKLAKMSAFEVRDKLALGSPEFTGARCNRRLVLSDTVIDWLDHPRPFPPLQQIIGAAVSPSFTVNAVDNLPSLQQQKYVLLHGFYTEQEKTSLVDVCEKFNMTVILVGERCFNESIWHRFCSQTGDRAILITSGDLACVQLAGICSTPMLVIPKLPEQQVVALRVRETGIGNALVGTGCTNQTAVEEQLSELFLEKNTYLVKLRMFGEAARKAGGVPLAAYWIRNALTLGLDTFLPLECGLAWYQRLLLDVYVVYVCALFGFILLLKAIWGYLSGTLDSGFKGNETNNMHTHTQDNRSHPDKNASLEKKPVNGNQVLHKRNRRGTFSYERILHKKDF